ncbi:MAG: SGNH/GDSL hydrolase family protein [Patescibacteria group bacterium]
MRRKELFINLGLLLATCVLFFGGIEAALRMTGLVSVKPNPPKIYQPNENPEISYELKPNISERAYRSTVTTNSLGFRGPELDPKKPLLVFLGDSITFGYGLEDDETIPRKAQKALPAWNVLNTASPGYNLRQQTAVFQEKIRKLDPKALVLIFHFNDVEDFGVAKLDDQGILRPDGWQPTKLECSPVERGLMQWIPGKCWLDMHSAFYIAVKKFVTARQGKKDLKEQETAMEDNSTEEPVTDESLRTYASYLDKLNASLPKDFPKLFVIWPERHMHPRARPKLRALAEQRGFQVLDLYDTFGNKAETLSWDTVHPSAVTAERGAEVIAEALRRISLRTIPPQPVSNADHPETRNHQKIRNAAAEELPERRARF